MSFSGAGKAGGRWEWVEEQMALSFTVKRKAEMGLSWSDQGKCLSNGEGLSYREGEMEDGG